MAYDSRAVGYKVLEIAQKKGIEDLSSLKLLKLVYFAHAWNLALRFKSLCKDPAEAWTYGPVFRNLYAALPRKGAEPVNLSILEPYKEKMSEDEIEIIDNVIDEYGKYPAFQLTKITHTPGSPWSETVAKKGTLSEMSNLDILKYYRKILK